MAFLFAICGAGCAHTQKPRLTPQLEQSARAQLEEFHRAYTNADTRGIRECLVGTSSADQQFADALCQFAAAQLRLRRAQGAGDPLIRGGQPWHTFGAEAASVNKFALEPGCLVARTDIGHTYYFHEVEGEYKLDPVSFTSKQLTLPELTTSLQRSAENCDEATLALRANDQARLAKVLARDSAANARSNPTAQPPLEGATAPKRKPAGVGGLSH